MLRVPWGMGVSKEANGSRATGSPTTLSAKKEVLVLNGWSYSPYTWPAFYGVPAGPGKESACGVTISQWWLA